MRRHSYNWDETVAMMENCAKTNTAVIIEGPVSEDLLWLAHNDVIVTHDSLFWLVTSSKSNYIQLKFLKVE